MNEHSVTLRGKERYKSGVMEYKKMGYWEPDYEPKDTDIIALFRVTPSCGCLLYTSPSPRDRQKSRMPSSA